MCAAWPAMSLGMPWIVKDPRPPVANTSPMVSALMTAGSKRERESKQRHGNDARTPGHPEAERPSAMSCWTSPLVPRATLKAARCCNFAACATNHCPRVAQCLTGKQGGQGLAEPRLQWSKGLPPSPFAASLQRLPRSTARTVVRGHVARPSGNQQALSSPPGCCPARLRKPLPRRPPCLSPSSIGGKGLIQQHKLLHALA